MMAVHSVLVTGSPLIVAMIEASPSGLSSLSFAWPVVTASDPARIATTRDLFIRILLVHPLFWSVGFYHRARRPEPLGGAQTGEGRQQREARPHLDDSDGAGPPAEESPCEGDRDQQPEGTIDDATPVVVRHDRHAEAIERQEAPVPGKDLIVPAQPDALVQAGDGGQQE